MHLSQSGTVITIGLLFSCACSSAADRSASSSQRYRIHVPNEVQFGRIEPSAVSRPAEQPANEVAGSVAFLAETTSGMTIQFDTQSESPQRSPLRLSLGGSQQGNWSVSKTDEFAGTTHQPIAEATSVQASTLGAGWTTLTIDVVGPSAVSDATLTTIVVTIVAH